jgi:sulfur carrier protein
MPADLAAPAVPLTLNGEAVSAPPGASLADLLRRHGRDPEQPGIAVAVDGAVVRRALWEETSVEEGAEVEVITASQGG